MSFFMQTDVNFGWGRAAIYQLINIFKIVAGGTNY